MKIVVRRIVGMRCKLSFQGLPGKVLEVRAVRRTGDDNLVSCMRKTLEDGHPGHIGLGGVFCATK